MRRILIGLGVVVIAFAAYVIYMLATTKNHSPEAVAKYENGGEIRVEYCRPFKKERTIFGPQSSGALVPYGQKWRTGANEATEISLDKDIELAGELLNAGTYSVYTIPGKNAWTIAINSKTDYWGASLSGSPFEENMDVLRVQVKPQKTDEVAEQFTMDFEESGEEVIWVLAWDQTRVEVPIKIL
jgi:hypothetical protein